MALWCRAVRTVNRAAPFHRRKIFHSLVLRRLLAQLLQQAWRGIGKRGDRPDAPRLPPASMREAFEALLRSENYEAAYALAEKALARDAESYEARLLLGRSLQKLHEPERALECFELARRVRPDDAELYDFRGSMYQELGRLREAMADYESGPFPGAGLSAGIVPSRDGAAARAGISSMAGKVTNYGGSARRRKLGAAA